VSTSTVPPTNQTTSFETQMIPMTPQVLRRTLRTLRLNIMVLEKVDAGAAAHSAGALALVGGKSVEAATKLAMAPIKRRVQANHLRLMRG
jgi:hypothetical protein